MIPRLYSESETDFFSNGICALSESVSATVTEEANSIFTLELEYPIHGMWFSEIKRSRLIKALPNVGDEEHIFRIKEIVKSTNPKTVRIYASTKSEDLNGHIIKEFERRDTAANVVLSSLPAAIYPPTNYLFHTDITTKVSPYWFMRNVTNSILGSEGSLVDLLGGGELKRNNDSLYLYRRRGRDNVTRVTPRKNLRGLEITESTKGLITRIQPYMILQDPETYEDIVVIGDVVSSPLANNYPNQNVVPMDFSGYELENKTQLNQLAASYFTSMNPGCDKPKVTLNVDLINIHDSAEYSKFKDFETVKLFDTVTVYVPRYDVDVLVKIVSVTFDVLREKVIQITAGQPSSTFVQDLNKTYNDALSNVGNTLKKDINTAQVSADGKNMIFYGSGQPTATRIGDTWFKPNGMETEMLIWTGSGWENPFLGGDNIADESITGSKIANATIGSAKIINVDAYKITVGTLTGHTIDSAYINGGTISGGTINGTNITGGTFYNSGTRGDFHVYDGMARATSYNTVADGTIFSEDGYITLRAGGTGSESHVFLQSVTEVRATRPREFSTFIPIVASEFRIPGWTYLARNVWSTYGNGIEDMFIKPSDVGSLRVISAGNGSYRPIMASAFNQSSSREFKYNIKSLQESGLEVIRGFNIVTYNLKDDPNKEIQVGLIAEDNRIVSSFEGDSINIYKMTSYNSKAIQELDKNQKEMEITIWQLKNEIQALKGALNE